MLKEYASKFLELGMELQDFSIVFTALEDEEESDHGPLINPRKVIDKLQGAGKESLA